MRKFIVTVYTSIGDIIVTASSAEEACTKVIDPDHKRIKPPALMSYFNHGYNANLHVVAREI